MSEIYQYNDPMDYKNIRLGVPKPVQGGGYYSNIKLNDDSIYIQTPKIYTKNGISVTGRKIYSDLLFHRDDLDFISFINNIEDSIKNLIYDKKNIWFTEEPTMDDIEDNWISSVKTYKNNKFLIRTNIERSLKKVFLQLWNQNEEEITMNDIDKESKLIAIFEISGLKFSSTSFHLDIILKQIMKFEKVEIFSKCLIKRNNKKENLEKSSKNKIIEVEEGENNESDNDDDTDDDSDNLEDNDDSDDDDSDDSDDSDDDDSDDDEDDEEDDEDDQDDEDDKEDNQSVVEDKVQEVGDKTVQVENKPDEVEDKSDQNNEDGDKDNLQIKEDKENKEDLINTQLTNNQSKETGNVDNVDNNSKEELNVIKEKVDSDSIQMSNMKKEILNDIQEKKNKSLEKNTQNNDLNEITLEISDDNSDILKLKNPNDVYMEIYKNSLKKAKEAKKKAIKAFLEAKKIKEEYILNDLDSSDDEDLEEFSE